MKRCFQLIEQIRDETTTLNSVIAKADDESWTKKIELIHEMKTELETLMTRFDDPDVINGIQTSIMKRREKRNRIKKMEMKVREMRESRFRERQIKSDQIDDCLKERIARVAERKQKIEETNRAGEILAGVTKKKNEARKYLNLLDSLVELRRVRRIQSGKSEIGERDFVERMEQLKRVWVDALANYQLEEEELRKYLVEKPNGAAEMDWQKVIFGRVDGEGRKVDFRTFLQIR